jgi:hypothetical protein
MNLPGAKDERFFHFVEDAQARGAVIQVLQGEARPLLEKAPDGFYHAMIIEAIWGDDDQKLQEKLLTKEGMKLCMDKLAAGGVLCYHTSCRYYTLAEQVSATAHALGFAVMIGHDPYHRWRRNDGRYTSEWVMVARKRSELAHLKEPPVLAKNAEKAAFPQEYWSEGRPDARLVWSDGKISYKGMFRGDPVVVRPLRDLYYDLLPLLPESLRRHDGVFARTIEGILRALEDFRVLQLNGGMKQ